MGSCIFRSLQVQTTCKQFAMQIAKLIEADGMETPIFILLHEKFLHFDWFRAMVFLLKVAEHSFVVGQR